MLKEEGRAEPKVCEGVQKGLRLSVRKAFADVPSEPLPVAHIDLLLALRRREREQVGRKAA